MLAFPGKSASKPVYVLIDCGYKPGSPDKIVPPTDPDEIAASIIAATGGHVDVAVMTHEHQDHVNGITKKHFSDLEIGETWVAWTEDPDDDVAKALRKKVRKRKSAKIRFKVKVTDVQNRRFTVPVSVRAR